MSDIEYGRQHGLPLKQAKAIAQMTADDLAKEYDLVSEWQDDTLHFHRSGVQGQMDVTAVQIKLHVTLSFPLSLMKGTFETNIKKYIDKRLSEAKTPAKAPAKTSAKVPGKVSAKVSAKAPAKKVAKKA